MKELAILNTQLNYHKIVLTDYWPDTLIKSVYMSTEIFNVLYNNYVDSSNTKFDPHVEHGAFLLGKYIQTDSGQYTITIDQLVVVEAEQQSISNIQFGSEAWLTLDTAMEDNPEVKIVGWFHTHPGHGIFLSRDDLNVSYTYFNKPYQLALLLDNQISMKTNQLEMGLFSFKENGEINNF